jgi:hypothetical protein
VRKILDTTRSLGILVADAASVVARGIVEYHNGGSKPETKSRFGDLIVQLYYFWFASRYHSFNGECRVMEAILF